jgi:hypothetical protein
MVSKRQQRAAVAKVITATRQDLGRAIKRGDVEAMNDAAEYLDVAEKRAAELKGGFWRRRNKT